MKKEIKSYLLKREFDRIAELGEPGRIVRALLSLSYDKTDEIAWRAMEAIGRLVHIVSRERPDFGREVLRRLLWSIRDEAGGIGWSSPEIIGEIVKNDPSKYSDIPRILWSFMDEEFLRKGIIWAMGRIGEVAPELVEFTLPFLRLIAKNDRSDEIKFYARWAICKIAGESATETSSEGELRAIIYDRGELREFSLSEFRRCKEESVSHSQRAQNQEIHGADNKDKEARRPVEEFSEKGSLRCPFCSSPVQRPVEIKNGFADILGGRCLCGALYAYDPSGRALGEVLMDALAILCRGDYNKAVSLEEGKDYIIKYFMYEPYLNKIAGYGSSVSARQLIFIKMLI